MATKRKALGRGLNALLPSAPSAGEKAVPELPIDQIIPNKYQPRSSFDPATLQELAQSIKANGIVQPLIVRKIGSQYHLITGERRWRAARLAGLKTVPAVIREVSEFKQLEWALIENIQRQDLNPIEEASAYATLVDDFSLTQEEVAQRVGKDRSSVANYMRLLKLPAEIRERIQKLELSMGHARAISSLEKEKDQLELVRQILKDQLNVRQTEALARNWKTKKKPRPAADTHPIDPNIKAAEQKLQERFGTRVVIRTEGNEKGRIEIHYENSDDLIRIYELIMGKG